MKARRRMMLVGIAGSFLFAGQVASGEERVIEYSCGVTGPGAPTTVGGRVAIVRVLELKKSGAVQLPIGADPVRHSVTCARSLLVPSVNDVKILDLGFNLFIGASGKKSVSPRAGVLTGTRPNIVFLVIDGKQSKSEADMTAGVLKEINGR